jgi:hypothetical protein
MASLYKEILSAIAIGLTFLAFFPYIRSVMRGSTKPHVFSWIIWGSTTLVVFAAQLADGGGAGAWPIGFSGVVTIYVAALAYAKQSDITITRADWLFFLAAAASLPCWYLTADPLWAVVILTAVDAMGFGPTVRKAYHHPFDEQLTFFVLMAARNVIAAIALERYSLTTLLFPAVIAGVCAVFIAIVLYRRLLTAD